MKKIKLYIISLLLINIFISCSASKHEVVSNKNKPVIEKTKSEILSSNSNNHFHKTKTIKRKNIFSAFLSLTVEKPDTTNVHLKKIAKKYNGYINEIGTYKTIIRVKNKNLDNAIKEISTLGKLQSKDILGQDVTDEYFDYQIRLENSEKARDKYLKLLEKAKNVEAVLKVEKELERLNETIDLLKGKINRIDHLSNYSTITISLTEKKKPGILGYIVIGLYHSIKWLFVRN